MLRSSPLCPSGRPSRIRPVLLALLLLGLAGPAAAQTPLQLLDRVDGLGKMPREGAPLPESTRVVLLPYEAPQAHTLPNADVSRKELSRRVVDHIESEGERPPLGPDGTTPWTVAPTAQSGAVSYLLAETPDSTLYESYVNTGRGFVPGFDAVQSGRMTMGPVPEPARARMRSALRVGREALAQEAADTTTTPDPSPAPSTAADTTVPDTTTPSAANADVNDANATAPSGSGPSPPADPSPSPNPIGMRWVVLGALGGAFLGGGAVWWWLSVRLRRLEDERADLQRTLRERKNKAFRAATGMGGDAEETNAGTPDQLRALQEENAELRERNQTLKTKITEIKEHLRALRDAE